MVLDTPLFPASFHFALKCHLESSFLSFSLRWTSEVSVGTAVVAGTTRSAQRLHGQHAYAPTFVPRSGGEHLVAPYDSVC